MNTDSTNQGLKISKTIAALKQQYPDALILMRRFDNYVIFAEDAIKAGASLNLAPTTDEATGLQCVTFPFSHLDVNLPKLIRSGNRIAIMDYQEPIKTIPHRPRYAQ